MSTLPLKSLFHRDHLAHRIDTVFFIILSLLILVPLTAFLYGVFCMIMCLVQNMCGF